MIAMCVHTELQEHGDRITVLESKNNTPEDLAAVQAELDNIKEYLFGVGGMPAEPRDTSNIQAV